MERRKKTPVETMPCLTARHFIYPPYIHTRTYMDNKYTYVCAAKAALALKISLWRLKTRQKKKT